MSITRSLDQGMTVLSCQNVATGSRALAWPAMRFPMVHNYRLVEIERYADPSLRGFALPLPVSRASFPTWDQRYIYKGAG